MAFADVRELQATRLQTLLDISAFGYVMQFRFVLCLERGDDFSYWKHPIMLNLIYTAGLRHDLHCQDYLTNFEDVKPYNNRLCHTPSKSNDIVTDTDAGFRRPIIR